MQMSESVQEKVRFGIAEGLLRLLRTKLKPFISGFDHTFTWNLSLNDSHFERKVCQKQVYLPAAFTNSRLMRLVYG